MCVVLCRVALETMESLPFLETRYLISSGKEIATFGIPDTKRFHYFFHHFISALRFYLTVAIRILSLLQPNFNEDFTNFNTSRV
jgi:hypothetical protein